MVILKVYADTITSVDFCKIFSNNLNQSLKMFNLTQDKIKKHLSTCVPKWFWYRIYITTDGAAFQHNTDQK